MTFINSLPNPLHLVNFSAVRLKDATFDAILKSTEVPFSDSRHSFSNTLLTTNAIPLMSLSTTVFAFMEIHQHHQDWTQDMVPVLYWLTLSNFSFLQPFAEDDMPANMQITVKHLISALSRLAPSYLTLSNCSLNYVLQTNNIAQEEYEFHCSSICFDTTFGSFIETFLRLLGNAYIASITISNCLTPVHYSFGSLIRHNSLNLDNIHTHTAMRMDFPSNQLRVTNCTGFDNELLKWLAQTRTVPSGIVVNIAVDTGAERREGIFAAKNLGAIRIHNCNNFRSPALRHLMETRHINFLLVDGDVPDLG